MQLAKLDCSVANTLHPASMAYILSSEGGPDGYRFERASTSGCLEANTTRVFITEDAESVQISGVGDFTA